MRHADAEGGVDGVGDIVAVAPNAWRRRGLCRAAVVVVVRGEREVVLSRVGAQDVNRGADEGGLAVRHLRRRKPGVVVRQGLHEGVEVCDVLGLFVPQEAVVVLEEGLDLFGRPRVGGEDGSLYCHMASAIEGDATGIEKQGKARILASGAERLTIIVVPEYDGYVDKLAVLEHFVGPVLEQLSVDARGPVEERQWHLGPYRERRRGIGRLQCFAVFVSQALHRVGRVLALRLVEDSGKLPFQLRHVRLRGKEQRLGYPALE